uniref:Protein kinase domain-containing protein n=1 Tax=Glossina morsitans morsitans TaxID=37546 RepID=A0A1B0G8C0_GLOMM
MGIIYRDSKLEKIFLDVAKRSSSQSEDRAYTFCGTPGCTAQEILRGCGRDCTVDWWSIGVLTCEFEAGEGSNSFSEMDPILPSAVGEMTRGYLMAFRRYFMLNRFKPSHLRVLTRIERDLSLHTRARFFFEFS